MGRFNKIVNAINRISVDAGVALLVVMILASFTQVLCRYVLHVSSAWCEEIARVSFTYASLLGVGACIAEGANPVMSMCQDYLRRKGSKKGLFAQHMFAYAVMLLISLFLIPVAAMFMKGVSIQATPQMRINLSYLYLSIPVGLSIAALNIANNILKDVRDYRREAGAYGADRLGETKGGES